MNSYDINLDKFIIDMFARHPILQNKEIKAIHKIPEAQVNQMYRVETNQHKYYTKLMVRTPLDEIEVQRFKKTEYVCNLLKQHTTVQVPKIIDIQINPTIDEHTKITIYSTMIQEEVSGKPMGVVWDSLSLENKCRLARQFGKSLMELNNIEVDRIGKAIGTNIPIVKENWNKFFKNKMTEQTQYLIDQDPSLMDPKLLQKALNLFIKSKEIWNYQDVPRLIHNDLWSGNLMIDVDRDTKIPSISGFLDFEWSSGGDPFLDLLWIDHEIFDSAPEPISEFYKTLVIDPSSKKFLKKKHLHNMCASIFNAATGYLHHNPEESSFRRMEEIISKAIDFIEN